MHNDIYSRLHRFDGVNGLQEYQMYRVNPYNERPLSIIWACIYVLNTFSVLYQLASEIPGTMCPRY